MARWYPIRPRDDRPLVVAHRGSSGVAPENTLGAFELAARHGADIIEVDVHLTADDHLVVIHDATLLRTTDAATRFPDRAPWSVRDFTLDEIRQLSAGEVDGRSQQVPTFVEVLDLVRRLDLGLLVETKTEFTGERLEPAVAAEVKRLDDWEEWVPARLMVCSFELASLGRARAELPGVHLAFILVVLVAGDGRILDIAPVTPGVAEAGRSLEQLRDDLVARGVGYLGMALFGVNGAPVDDFTEDTVAFFRSGGVEVNLITDDPETMRRLTDRGVSSILTNHPARLAELIGTERLQETP